MSDSKEIQASSQPVFNFGDHSVRVVVRDGEPWFVANDVCGALEYKNTSDAVATHLDDDERSTIANSESRNGGGSLVVINESGLYALVLRSRKPEARKFAKWVTSEVLPAIRKTGIYVGKPFAVNPGDVLTQEEQNTLRLMLKSAADRLPKSQQGALMVKGWSKLKSHFGVTYREIPRQEFSEAVSIVARHTAEWELVEEAPKDNTLSAAVDKMVSWVKAGNGYPVELFMPIYEAITEKMERIRAKPAQPAQPAIDPLNAPAMVAARKVAGQYFADYRDAVKTGKPNPSMGELPQDVLHGMVAQALFDQRMLSYFDWTTGRMHTQLVPSDSAVFSFSRGEYSAMAEHIPMERLPEALEALNRRVSLHLGAFRDHLKRGRVGAAAVNQTASAGINAH